MKTTKKQPAKTNFYIPEIKIKIEMKRGVPYNEQKGINNPKDMADVMRQMFDQGTINWTEECVMLCLNTAHKVIGYHKLSTGGVTAAIMDARAIATIALNNRASVIALAHNHPSGSLTPSEVDIKTTIKIKQGLALLDITLLDHLIITDCGYTSLSEEGII